MAMAILTQSWHRISGSAPGQIYVALNKGDGTLGAMNLVVQGIDYPYMSSINVADVNADGKPDLLLYSYGQVAIYQGNGDGTFSAAPGGAVRHRI